MTTERKTEDAILVRQSRRGDRRAFGRLVRRYQDAAYATALSRVCNPHDARDIVQDAFIAAYCKLGQLREPRRFASWLRSIVLSRSLEWVRRQSSRPRIAYSLGQEDLHASAAKRWANQRGNADLWDAVDALPEKYREVVMLHYVDGFSYREAADFMDLPVSTVKGRLQQARLKLRESLAPTPKRDEKELIMRRPKVEKEVTEAICKIARGEIEEKVPLGDTKHIVLYCGVGADIEIHHTDGEDAVLAGTKFSVGLSEDQARSSLDAISIRSDQVDDWQKSGPHPGEIFCGTSRDEEGRPVAIKHKASDVFRPPGKATKAKLPSLIPQLYPEMRSTLQGDIAKALKGQPAKATRISMMYDPVHDVVLPRRAFTKSVRDMFTPNWTSQDLLHGPAGSLSLAIGIPANVAITLFSVHPCIVGVRRIRSDLNIIHGSELELSDVEGDVCLLETAVKRAQGIRGRFWQTYYGLGGMEWSDYQGHRVPMCPDSVLQDITGDVRVDVAKVNLEASRLKGQVEIRNRFGPTRLHLTEADTGSKCRIESDSGEVLAFIKEELLGEMDLCVNSLSGLIKYDALRDSGEPHTANNTHVNSVSTKRKPSMSPDSDADLCIKTRDGSVTIEKTV